MPNYCKLLSEAGVEVCAPDVAFLSEAAQVKVTDEVLTKMFKFITDKYNAIDFSEIEKSAGNINTFKYNSMIRENIDMLDNIYSNTPDPGAAKYREVIAAMRTILNHLTVNAAKYTTMYKKGNGVVQLIYTSLIASCLYCTGTLVTNTIRFVTTEKDTDCQVLFDEIPSAIKHVHVQSVLGVAKDIDSFDKLINELSKTSVSVNESLTISSTLFASIAIPALVLMLIPRIITLIREIIYSIYFSRVRISEMLGLQADLIRTNIESLEAGRGNKKIIARQKKIVDKLDTWKNRIAVKMDTTNALVRTQINKESHELKIDKSSSYMQNAGDYSASDLLI